MGIFDNILTAPSRAFQGALQLFDRNDNESRGNTLVNRTVDEYKATPAFKSILDRTNPIVSKGGWQDNSNLKSVQAAGQYFPKQWYGSRNSRMDVSDITDTGAMLHEGLHGAYDEQTPSEKAFGIVTAADNRSPELEAYLRKRLSPYKNFKQNLSLNMQDVDIQNEMHSFSPEYYYQGNKNMPPALQKYYDQYFTRQPQNRTNWRMKRRGQNRAIQDLLHGTQYDPFSKEQTRNFGYKPAIMRKALTELPFNDGRRTN